MKKKIGLFGLIALVSITFVSCKGENVVLDEGTFETKEVDFYTTNVKPERKINLRFYENTPSIPYVGVKQFFKEFYKCDLSVVKDDNYYTFKKGVAKIDIDTKKDIMKIHDIDTFARHPDFKQSNSIVFLKEQKLDSTPLIPTIVDLREYGIDTHKGASDAYVPIQLISGLATGCELFEIVYNGKALFEFDQQGQLSDSTERLENYYGELYKAPLKEKKERKEDMIKFSYGLICLMIDNFRGFTTQMEFIDNNILSLGLNGTLEKYYPEIKKFLLSKDIEEYYSGVSGLFLGLFDGGHTALLSNIPAEVLGEGEIVSKYSTPECGSLFVKTVTDNYKKSIVKSSVVSLKKAAFNLTDTKLYYHLVADKKLAYLGFDQFEVNYDAWNEYYTKLSKNEDAMIPVDDTYGFIRSKMYQALSDGVENLVIDMTSNGGGDSLALLGILGLLNGGKATMSMNDVASHKRNYTTSLIDVNCDGKYDELDEKEADKFKDMNITILTSSYAFSCGNLLPSLLKELEYKTIGEKTGGGSCAIMLGATGEGLYYVRSSYTCLSNETGRNIDDGVPVDYDLVEAAKADEQNENGSYAYFFDVNKIVEVLNKLYK